MSNNFPMLELTRVVTYRACYRGKDIGTFALDSEWEGFAKLSNGTSHVIVQQPSGLAVVLSDLMSPHTPLSTPIIAGSPGLMDSLKAIAPEEHDNEQ